MRIAGLVLVVGCQAVGHPPPPIAVPAPHPLAPRPADTPLDRVARAAARSAAAHHVISSRELRDAMASELGSGVWPYVLAARGGEVDTNPRLARAIAELRETVAIASVGRAATDGPEGRVDVIVALPAPTLPIAVGGSLIEIPWMWPAEPTAFAVTPTETRRLPGSLVGGVFALAVDCRHAAATIEINAGSSVVASVTNACGAATAEARVEDPFDVGPPARTRIEIEQRLFELVNRERRARGSRPIAWDEDAHRFAREHAAEMARFAFVGHESADGRTAETRLRSVPARGVYENVGRAGGPGEAHHGFMTSRGHRANLLARDAVRGAVGVERDPRDPQRFYVTEIFLY